MKTVGTLTHGGFSGKHWLITAQPHVAIKLKRLFPRIPTNSFTSYQLKDTPEICKDLEWFAERYPFEMSSEDAEYLRERASAHDERVLKISDLLSGVDIRTDFTTAIPLREYQNVVPNVVLEQGFLLCCDDLGLGKTAAGIGLLTVGKTRPALVVTLTSLTNQWQRELARFAPNLRSHILTKGTVYDLTAIGQRKNSRKQLSLINQLPDVIICNYAKLSGWAEYLSKIVKTVIYDEAQELRRDDSQKSAAARCVSAACAYRLGLTGSPVYNYGEEIFNVLDAISPECLGEKDEFLREWCMSEGSRSYALVNPVSFGTYARANGFILRRTIEEVGLEVPKATTIMMDISTDAALLHNVQSPAAELARFILSGDKSGRGEKMQASGEFERVLRQSTGLAKAPHVADFVKMLAESGEKVVLFGWHHAVYDVWMERLADLNPRLFTGQETAKQKQDSVDAFINGICQVLIISLRSGVGLDGLQGVCRIGVFGELDWSPKVHEQCSGRLDRPGQKRPVLLYYLTANDGSDPTIIDILGVKQNQSDGILDPDNTEDHGYLDSTGDHIRKLAEEYLSRHSG